ncbi:MAG: flagellin FliC [Zetaproteobacteria bacterium]|nr:flagellin FliC [Pseudobdellovibrionaceae bacterium]|tara:strand:+ start:730 stop:1614 length:885 start_codon:yes stop_codon:yes gene_type:complete
MGLRIKTNVGSLKAQRNLGNTNTRMEDNITKLSSGHRINKSADDAAGLAISATMYSKIRSSTQAKRNANDGISMIQVAEGSFNEITNIMVRLRELSIQSSSDSVGDLERSFANKEYVELVDEIDRIANSTEFGGYKLLKGADANEGLDTLNFHISAGDDSVANRDSILVDIEAIKIDSGDILGLGKGEEVGPMDADGDFNREVSTEKLTVLDDAMNKVAGFRANLGAKQSRLMSTVQNLGVVIENLETSRSRIQDTDFASETAKLTQNRILGQSGVSVLAQGNSQPEQVLGLLR